MHYSVRSAEPTAAQYLAEELYRKYQGCKTGIRGTAYQDDGVCLCFDGGEGRFLWGVRVGGVKSRTGAELPATGFEVRDITLDAQDKEELQRAVREVRLALGDKK